MGRVLCKQKQIELKHLGASWLSDRKEESMQPPRKATLRRHAAEAGDGTGRGAPYGNNDYFWINDMQRAW